MLAKGMIITTSYGTGPYRIKRIRRDCTCAKYLDRINGRGDVASPSHVHLTCEDPIDGRTAWLNGYDEETLESVWSDDRIAIKEVEGAQPSLF